MSYINDLRANLKALPKNEIDEAILYYEEYLADGELSDGAAVAEFGTPKNLARRLVADYYMDAADEEMFALQGQEVAKVPAKSPFKLTWFIILAIFASPILIPVAIVVVVMIFTVAITAATLIFTILCVLFTFAIVAVFAIFGGIMVLPQSITGGLFYISAGLAVVGALILLSPVVLTLIKAIKTLLVKFITWIGKKIIRKGGQKL
ncbi:membrane protein [Lactococcus hodotermopsidis]|uniref:Membrane protein n=1 Tax=Pseudolactococcus hodotermopsidis TaxID=2709157 RepID=A0A6A0BFU3_9LACT|nr:DUF1700 domain-containing protein [Lactococcus hodotermopsidis]GFH43218.1 membrane protein [Lactococcus hodotermopsidis]